MIETHIKNMRAAIILASFLLSILIINNSYAQTDDNIQDDVSIVTIVGNDTQGNNIELEVVLSRGIMMMSRGSMMMDPTMMFGMPMMMQMMNMGQGMGMGMGMSQDMMTQMQQKINLWIRSHYLIQGGSITIDDSTYIIEAGSARISNDKIFINAIIDQGLSRNGKVITWGVLNSDDGLKGRILIWESRTQLTSIKFTAKGSIESAF